jgi:hypothetical protein
MKKLQNPLLLASLAFIIACSEPAPPPVEADVPEIEEPVISTEQSQAVLNHHLEAFGQNDLDGIIADYTEESILITPDSTYKGLEQIRGLYEGLFPLFPTDGTVLELDKMVVDGSVAYIIWHASTPAIEVPFATDSFIVVDGKIMNQTFAGIINPKEES